MGKLLQPMPLDGIWRFKLDEKDIGIAERWYAQNLEERIRLPGILQSQGFGFPISVDTPFAEGLHDRLWFLRDAYKRFTKEGTVKIPFLSQPARHYMGAAWYQTDIEIPSEWEKKRVELHLERTRWKTSVWVDELYYGDYDSLCAEHVYDLGILKPGNHVLSIRIDNRMIFLYRPDAHSVSDSVGSGWNGIVGKIELVPTSLIYFGNISVYPDSIRQSAVVRVRIVNISGSQCPCVIKIKKTINLNCGDGRKYPKSVAEVSFSEKIVNGETTAEYTIPLGGDASTWDEFNPALHKFEFALVEQPDGERLDARSVTFGLRNIATNGRNFVLNGKNISFRGTHDGGCFPLTGYPATDVAEWRRILSICKEWGLNHVRFHSWCPPEAAFAAADEAGIYLQVECGMWNYFTPGGAIETQLHIETDRILRAYGNHASFLLFSPSNEPHGDYRPCLKNWVAKYRKLDNRRLYCVASGWFWPKDTDSLKDTDYFYTCSRGKGRMRGIHGWFGRDYSAFLEDLEAPFLAHELGQSCAYPDFSVIRKFTGYLRPGNYEIFRHSLTAHKMLHKNADFAKASGIFQLAAYKEEVEANLRTFGYSGFSLLDLHDYLGQGTALVGLLDAFWDKKQVDPKQFTRFCGPVVLLARIYKAVYTPDENLCCDIECACYAETDLRNAAIYWEVVDAQGRVFNRGSFSRQDIKTGGNTAVGKIQADLSHLKTPAAYQLIVRIENTSIENDWKFWVYPQNPDFSIIKSVRVTSRFDEAVSLLKSGENVLFLPKPENLDYNCPPLSARPVFWNAQMGPKWSRSLGLWCDPSHPALAEFPTSCGMDWQWKEIIQDARGINMEALPDQLEPFIWPIDDWNRNYKLALAFECRLYNGKLAVCSADLKKDLEKRPAARQLLYSILKYMGSDKFSPAVEVTEQQLRSFLFDTTVMKKLNAKVTVAGSGDGGETAHSGEPPYAQFSVRNLTDGDPNTYWLAGGEYGGKYPFVIDIEIPKAVSVKGIAVMPRQNHRDFQGAVKKYEIDTSMDGFQWSRAATGEFPASFDLKKVYFTQSIPLRKLRLKLIEGFGADNLFYWKEDGEGFRAIRAPYHDEFASLAEVSFLCDENVESSDPNAITIKYQDVGTASKEIY